MLVARALLITDRDMLTRLFQTLRDPRYWDKKTRIAILTLMSFISLC